MTDDKLDQLLDFSAETGQAVQSAATGISPWFAYSVLLFMAWTIYMLVIRRSPRLRLSPPISKSGAIQNIGFCEQRIKAIGATDPKGCELLVNEQRRVMTIVQQAYESDRLPPVFGFILDQWGCDEWGWKAMSVWFQAHRWILPVKELAGADLPKLIAHSTNVIAALVSCLEHPPRQSQQKAWQEMAAINEAMGPSQLSGGNARMSA